MQYFHMSLYREPYVYDCTSLIHQNISDWFVKIQTNDLEEGADSRLMILKMAPPKLFKDMKCCSLSWRCYDFKLPRIRTELSKSFAVVTIIWLISTFQGSETAELQVLGQAGPQAEGSTVYINLETNDCDGDDTSIRALVQSGVSRVVVGLSNPLAHCRHNSVRVSPNCRPIFPSRGSRLLLHECCSRIWSNR